MKYLIEMEDEDEFVTDIRRYMLEPFKVTPFASSLAPDVPEDSQGIYDYFRYNFVVQYRQQLKQQKMTYPMLIVVAVFFVFINVAVIGLRWEMLLAMLLPMAILIPIFYNQWKKSQQKEANINQLEQKFKQIIGKTQ